jgi:adenosylhomocysteine nucleosidase
MSADGHPDRIAILAPMTSELRPIVKAFGLERAETGGMTAHTGSVGDVDIVAVKTGIGMQAAARATERLLDATEVDHVLVVGIAGGVHRSAVIGDVVVPSVVIDEVTGVEYHPSTLADVEPAGALVSSDGLLVDPDAFARLAEQGVVGLDMETAAVAAVCDRRGRAWSVVRSISDRPGDIEIDVMALAGADGSGSFSGVARFLVTQPWRIPQLVRLGRNSQRAANAASAAALAACTRPV